MVTPIASIPEIAQNQAAKYVTHNEAIRQLEALTLGSVIDRTLTAPPALSSPGDDGKVYIPASGATGAWAGQDDNIAIFKDDAWVFYPPFENLFIYSIGDSSFIIYQSGSWGTLAIGNTDELAKVSANDTTASFLLTKIVAGANITINEINDGGNETLEIVGAAGGTDELAKVSANDTTANFLLSKIVAGTGITVNELNDGGNETLEIVFNQVGTDELAKVSSNDTTTDYLVNKVVAGTNITVVETNDGGNETLVINSSAAGADEQVKVSANDTTTDYLVSKVVAGTNVTVVETNDGGNETLVINSTASGSAITLETDLVAWYELNDDPNWLDSTTNNNDLTEIGTVVENTGIIGNGAEFTNAASQALYIPIAPSAIKTDTIFTASCWVNTDVLSTSQTALAVYNTATNDIKWRILLSTNNVFEILFSTDGIDLVNFNTPITVATSTWYFLALIVNETEIEFYINDQHYTYAIADTLHTMVTGEFTIGNELSTSNRSWDGVIDQVGYWSRRLTAEEINYLYNNGSARAFGDLSTEVDQTQPDRLVRISTSDNASGYLETKLQGTGNIFLTTQNTDSNQKLLIGLNNDTLDLLTNLQAWWELDDDPNWLDSTANNNDLSEFSPVTNAPGIIGDGAEFIGGTEGLRLTPTDPNIRDVTTFSISAWYNADTSDGAAHICAIYNAGANQRKFQIRVRELGQILVLTSIDGINNVGYRHSAVTSFNSWHHVVVNFSPTEITIYVDNVPETYSIPGLLGVNTAEFTIGNRQVSSADTFDGTIDQVGFWNRNLNPLEVDFLYNSGAARTFAELDTSEAASLTVNTLRTNLEGWWELDDDNTWADSTGNGNSLTESGTVTTNTGIIGDGAEFTNAANQSLFIASSPANFNSTNEFTISLWVNFDTLTAGMIIAAMWTSSNRRFRIIYSAVMDTFQLTISSDGSVAQTIYSTFQNLTITASTWYHIVLSIKGEQINFHVNNQRENYTSLIGSIYTGGTSEFTIGNESSTSSDAVDGIIDQVGFWSRILSPEEINYLYNDGTARAYSATDITITKIDKDSDHQVSVNQSDQAPGFLSNKLVPTNNFIFREFNSGHNERLLLEIDPENPDIDLDLEAYWEVEDTSGTDSTGNGNTLSFNLVGVTTGIIGNGINFTNTSAEAVSTTATAIRDAQTMSVSLWFNTNQVATGNTKYILGNYFAPFNQRKLQVFFQTDGRFIITHSADGIVSEAYAPQVDFKLNTWYHMVLILDDSTNTGELYINNYRETWTISGLLGSVPNTNFCIGNRQSGDVFPFDGIIDEIGFWTRIITPQEVNFLYNQGLSRVYEDLTLGEANPRRVLVAAANVAVDADTSKVFNLTLNQNVIIDPPSNMDDGDELTFRILQNGTGGFTVTWNAVFKGTIPAMTGTASNMDIFKFHVVNGNPIYYASEQAITGVTF